MDDDDDDDDDDQDALNKDRLEGLKTSSDGKRIQLHRAALRASRLRRHFMVVAGILALAAGFVSTAAIWSKENISIIAAALAFGSGIISLFIDNYVGTEETKARFDGAIEYLSFRNKVNSLQERTPPPNREEIDVLEREYEAISQRFNKLLG